MSTHFLFMDEKYPDNNTTGEKAILSLAGVLLKAEQHSELRREFYELLKRIAPVEAGVVPPVPKIHASELLPNATEDEHFDFYESLTEILIKRQVEIYRVGYQYVDKMRTLFNEDVGVLSACFFSMLSVVQNRIEGVVWPVMEIDRTNAKHDATFSGSMQNLDYLTAQLGPENMSIDNTKFGELLYSTKRSATGVVADCVTYLLHQRYLKNRGDPQTEYKKKLGEIGERLQPIITYDEIIVPVLNGKSAADM